MFTELEQRRNLESLIGTCVVTDAEKGDAGVWQAIGTCVVTDAGVCQAIGTRVVTGTGVCHVIGTCVPTDAGVYQVIVRVSSLMQVNVR